MYASVKRAIQDFGLVCKIIVQLDFVLTSKVSVSKLCTSTCNKAYIPPRVAIDLHWQLSPTQMKCTCNANDSTYILYGFLNKIW